MGPRATIARVTGSAAATRDAVARERASFETSKAFWPVAFWTAQQLILDIFAARARTREGKLQVELAQLRYLLPWLGGAATVFTGWAPGSARAGRVK